MLFKKTIPGILITLLLLLTANCTSTNINGTEGTKVETKKRILLLGASVGKGWHLSGITERLNDDSCVFESIAKYQFDKSSALEEVLMRPKRKFRLTRTYLKGFFKPSPKLPDVIILKECAAYFPAADMASYKNLIRKWVKRVRSANIEVVLATVVPITRSQARKRPGRIESIWEYNDWIRDYTARENITLLDLEAALRDGDNGRYLKDEFTSGDGLHLNKSAYDVLDRLMLETVS